MKKKKLNLNELKVKSFVTSLNNRDSVKVKGGVTAGPLCEETMAGTPCINTNDTCPDGQVDHSAQYGGVCDSDSGGNTAGLCQTDGGGLCTN